MTPFAFLTLTPTSIVLLLIVGIFLFGKNLPDVGRMVGKSLKSIQDGLRGVESDMETATAPRRDPVALDAPRPPQKVATTAPKFENPDAPPAPPQA